LVNGTWWRRDSEKVTSFCEKLMNGTVVDQGVIPATRQGLTDWVAERTTPWIGAMEATSFTRWIYNHLLSPDEELKVAHPEMLKAIMASKKKNDAADAKKNN